MSKKLISAICSCIILICLGICALGYILGSPTFPWWISVFIGMLLCGIIYLMGNALRKEKK